MSFLFTNACPRISVDVCVSVRFCNRACVSGRRLREELEAKRTELREQTKKAEDLEGARERAEARAATRIRGLEELMEKNRRVPS